MYESGNRTMAEVDCKCAVFGLFHVLGRFPVYPLGRLWQEKTVLVKPNENGYGFTLSGEQPVYLEKLTEGSPAYLAGIRSRDKLIKVNGQSVFDKKHSEVVALLKGKFYY